MNLYIGNLDYSVKEIELEQLFSQFGDIISVKLITNPKTKKSKGFAFIDINNCNYNSLIQEIKKRKYRGRYLKINQGNQENKQHD